MLESIPGTYYNAQGNANRLLKLVTGLMDFKKADSNHLKLHIAKHDLIDFLNDIYASFEELSLKKTAFICS